TASYDDGVMRFADDLDANIRHGDDNLIGLLEAADDYIRQNGLDLPEEPAAHDIGPVPAAAADPLLELDLAGAGLTRILWATGFATDYSRLEVPGAVDERGRPAHRRGVSLAPGVYYLGLPWLSRRGSSFIWGVWHDAKYVADHILTQRAYLTYRADT